MEDHVPLEGPMIERFQDEEGDRRLLAAIADQSSVKGDPHLARHIAHACSVEELGPEAVLIEQAHPDNDVFFILAGSVDVRVNGRWVATRQAKDHVGEMAAIDPSAPRSATVVAGASGVVVARLTESALSQIADAHPQLWRHLAVELSARLRQRGSLVRPANATAKLFVGCSVEGLSVARALQEQLEHDPVHVTLWTDDLFTPGSNTAAKLVQAVDESDFGVFVLGPDDVTTSRDVTTQSPRDNVILELGMFMGLHGPERALFIRPRGLDLKLPTDLLGITALDYDATHAVNDPIAAVASAASKLRRHISDLGPR